MLFILSMLKAVVVSSPVPFHRFLMRPRTFLVVVKHNAMKNPVKQNFMVKNELFFELNDIKSCYIGRERVHLLFCFFVSVLLGVLLLLFLVFLFLRKCQ